MSIRNIAIIAHVDHGKTTLVDQLLRQSGTFRDNQQVAERVMDSNDLERERGITILAKPTSVDWIGEDGTHTRINIIDTPGHADFGGEVERILSMVDGVVLLVDAAEGPLPQTKFVTSKALALGLKPIVLINKVDRPDARADEVHIEAFDLFAALGATDEQLDFPTIFASAKQGWATEDLNAPDAKDHGMKPLFAKILSHFPEPAALNDGSETEPFSMLVTTIESDPYLGRILTGRIEKGTAKPNMNVQVLRQSKDGDVATIEKGRLSKVLAFRGIQRVPVEEAMAGDIVAIAGLQEGTVADTICDPSVTEAIAALPIDPPTLSITVSINDSPLAGREGTKVQSRVIRERLLKEAESNVAIKVSDSESRDAFEVAGRGELQLGVLIENMRREGFELSISRPRVLYREDENGKRLEPIEEATVDVDDEYTGVVIEKISNRKGEMIDMRPTGAGKTRIVFHCPSRGLIGYHGEFLTDTRGTGVMNRIFKAYEPYRGEIEGRRNGVLISTGDGDSVPYALWYLEERGTLFIGSGVKVYRGMIIGENARPDDMDVNPLKAKQLTNIRTTSKDEAVRLTPPRPLTLEQAIAYIEQDELVEVTPKSIRLRKRWLDPNDRKKYAKAG
ncbi:translational GTPase TypA [Parvibaculum sp.]|jgi:GTP-binding protein|uniref:translational GTPase TypA n=1 Tax=Parvibaculum sp. TaxID=2024848 RepID=UPI000C5E441D|nr:translational GTPase TypA [Parvibaculum sp.]MAM94803.1 translational GTPase TypA [Parvibaculum sp.]|tara:strand:- start:24722 stop:26581 length:1860 start_codon:yes stop_codon:yes gene_type:complete